MSSHPTEAELGEPDLKVVGLQLWIHGREFPDSEDYYDGNWLRVTAHTGAQGASVWVSGSILMVPDLVRWADQCEALHHARTDQAKLAPLERELAVTISPCDPTGHFMMRVDITPDQMTQEHTFQFEIDQSYLPGIVNQCRAIAKEYPIRGAKEKPGV